MVYKFTVYTVFCKLQVSEHGFNNDQLRSFEIYRNSIAGIDILTFDELYERSKFIVDAATPQQ